MRQNYHIQGMTCSSCVAKVTKALQEVDGVTDVTIDLDNKEAQIEMDQTISERALQEALAKKYTITATPKENIFSSVAPGSKATNPSKLQQLQPLLIILGYIAIASLMLHYKQWQWRAFMLDFMGLFYIVFSFFKILDLKGFPASFSMYDPLAQRLSAYGYIYPFIETALGLMLLMRFEIKIALIATLVILGITTIGVAKTLLDKKKIQCACLGTALKLPMTQATLIENVLMIGMALLMLFN